MICLAFDLATTTGWAVGDFSGPPDFGSELLGKSGTPHGARFTQALIMARDLISTYEPDFIACELAIAGGAAGGQERAQLAMGYRAAVHTAAFNAGLKPPVEIAVNSVRKFFLGSGAISGKRAKQMTIEYCFELGWEVEDDNQADALAVWCAAGNQKDLYRLPPKNSLFRKGSF
ncbi:MAG: hypothetical protein CMM07_25745 [Rhodopirellula sp.]|nr:hypothetical protein [Rhodopirellula sp.]